LDKQEIRRVLWSASLRTKSLDERLAAAQAGDFSHISIFPVDWRQWKADGLEGLGIRRKLGDAGVRVLAVDPFVQWVPGFTLLAGYPADYLSFIDFGEEEILQIAEELEAETINCVEGLGQRFEEAALVDAFGAFADRAHRRGLAVTLEFMPISSIPDLDSGWAIVSEADRPNAGLTFDTWHFFRSQSHFDLLERLPGAKIFEVQLADAHAELQGATLTDDLLRFRRLPGEGQFDLDRVIGLLKEIGAWRSVGPEVFSDEMDALGAREVGLRCGKSLDRFAAR
jgi:sugar phosphate isomerase/epimerase